MSNGIWIREEKPEKFSKTEKEIVKDAINCCIEEYEKLNERTKKIEIKAGRAYLYEHYEVNTKNGKIIQPLIDGKYLEMAFARITIYDKQYEKCSAEYQLFNGRWFTLTEGNLNNCIKYISKNEGIFN